MSIEKYDPENSLLFKSGLKDAWKNADVDPENILRLAGDIAEKFHKMVEYTTNEVIKQFALLLLPRKVRGANKGHLKRVTLMEGDLPKDLEDISVTLEIRGKEMPVFGGDEEEKEVDSTPAKKEEDADSDEDISVEELEKLDLESIKVEEKK